jgi:ribosomal protein L37AE/L43A
LLTEEKATALRQKGIHLDRILRDLEDGKFEDPVAFNREVGLGTLVALSGMVNGLALLADLLSIRQDCKVRPILGRCSQCNDIKEARRDEFGIWVCQVCGTRVLNPQRGSAQQMKRAFRRISLVEMVGNLEIIGGGIENLDGETEEPGMLHYLRRQLEMLNLMGIRSGAFAQGTFPALEDSTEEEIAAQRQSIVFKCGKCQTGLQAEASFAGTQATCPRCGATLQVPELVEPVRQATPEDMRELPEREAEDAILPEEMT